ncbi:MAG TPA: putative peptidoglycan glycosyltransferase FtsW [Sumerlaeia bacterium]|nr:putative peptidoglycan glycosyltransferase FtsW [Sumerlaeia bacterium]
MKQSPTTFNIPFRIFLLTALLASVGLVMVYSSSASYAANQRRVLLMKKIRAQLVDQSLADNPRYKAASPEERKRIQAVARKRSTPMARHLAADDLSDDHDYHHSRYVARQFLWIFLGLLSMFAAYRFDYHRLKACGPLLLGIGLVLLLLVFVPGVGKTINEDRRWIGFAGFTFQPSELAKLVLVIYMARMLTDHHDRIRSFMHGVVPALLLTSVFVLAVIVEPDVGGAAVLAAIVFLMWFISGMRILHLAGLGVATIPAFVYVVLRFPDRVARVLAFVNPTPEALQGPLYQLKQSLIAIGTGGLTGVGLGNSMQKHFLFEQFTDFIFAVIAEEMGLVGAVLIVLCYFLLIWEGWRVALRAPDFYAALLASGITLMLSINVIVNLMVVLGLAPTKGLALPLLSYGGSNALVTMTSMGVLMNIGRYIERQKALSPAKARRPFFKRPRAAKQDVRSVLPQSRPRRFQRPEA